MNNMSKIQDFIKEDIKKHPELKKEYEWLKDVAEHIAMPKEDGQVGLDLGIKDLCITSDGRKYDNPKTLAKQERKLSA